MNKEMYDVMYRKQSFQWMFRAKYDNVIKVLVNEGLKEKDNPLICDFGCGCGFMMKLLSEYGDVVGFDFEEYAIEYAKHVFDAYKEIHQMDLEKYSEKDRFDYGVIMDVLEHIEHDKIALKNIYTSMKCGGVLVITVPALMLLWSQHDQNCMHYRRYEKNELETKVKEAGFKIRYCGYYNFYMFFPLYVLRKIQRLFKIDDKDSHLVVRP